MSRVPSPESLAPNPCSSAPSPCSSSPKEVVACELAAEVVRTFGKVRFRAQGSSMLPAVWPGDILLVHRHDPCQVKPGDIVLFGRNGRLIAHRVVEVGSQESGVRSQEQLPTPHQHKPMPTLVTRGDRLDCNDAPVSSHELLGRVVSIQRGSRQLQPRQSIATRLASRILRQSEFATRVVVKLRGSGLGVRD